ncbi:MAG: histidine phosphatase family protein [Candidatus Uhrbacteria bacterium]|nr:histidine phosphatase family protein [Candidatus Uhrbacteria bacterium]
MTQLYLLRHGHVENPQQVFCSEGFPLSDQGAQEIVRLAHDFQTADISINAIISSPYLRTRETAEIMVQAMNLPEVVFDDRLKEWQVGSWFDRPFTEFYAATKYDQEPPPSVLPSEVESLHVMADRMVSAILEYEKQFRGKSILIVSHREPLVTALLSFQQKSFDEVHHVSFSMGSVWKLEFDEKGTFIKTEKVFDESGGT